ncbi:MAG: hypothetical protein SPI12_02775 [Actinomycetaceae bacterium]|nr:hypothetical protein [Actinomycetaceae bacterium]MDY6082772.1 hypothetical protein [Actinomycetaceae bacterium]
MARDYPLPFLFNPGFLVDQSDATNGQAVYGHMARDNVASGDKITTDEPTGILEGGRWINAL